MAYATYRQIDYIVYLYKILEEFGYVDFEFKTYSEYSKLSTKQAGVYIRKLENEMTPNVYDAMEEKACLEEIYGIGQE